MSYFQVLKLPVHTDSNGSLTVLEGVLPFDVVRIYWIYGANGQVRGGHRHRNAHQALVAVNGTVAVYMNDGVSSASVELDHPEQRLLVEPKDWHTMTFGEGAVLLVMSSHPYDRSEYIDESYA